MTLQQPCALDTRAGPCNFAGGPGFQPLNATRLFSLL